MNIGGYQPCSLCDYPGKVAAILFTQGCNFCCPFCHNKNLLPLVEKSALDADELITQVSMRRMCIDSIVVTGGEPTIHDDLPLLLDKIRKAGLYVKLDTDGSNPAMLKQLIRDRLVDYIAMDVKAPLAKYTVLTGGYQAAGALEESIKTISESGLSHQFRTTVVPHLFDKHDIEKIRKMLPPRSPHHLQAYRPPPDR